MPVDAETFKKTLGAWASGVAIVTSQLGSERLGMTVSAFSSVSLSPPLVLICADKGSSTNALIRKSRVFTVNVLSNEQSALSNLFADKAREAIRFDGLECALGATGCPRLPGALSALDCRVRNEIDAGDHIVYIAGVEAASFERARDPLVYFRGGYKALVPL